MAVAGVYLKIDCYTNNNSVIVFQLDDNINPDFGFDKLVFFNYDLLFDLGSK